MRKIQWLKIAVLLFLLLWYGVFLARKINLTTADLGRHLKNGELIVKSLPYFKKIAPILETNFYSYTEPDFPFVNHHWLGGVIFFGLWRVIGFSGLSLFFIFLSFLVFLLFFDLARREADFKTASILSLFLIPLIAERNEIRPEVFGYLFIGLFFWICWHYKNNLLSPKWLFLLPLLEIFWVNTHITFIFGPILLVIFLVSELIISQREKIKKLGIILISTVLATFLNPAGLKGVFYPFNIFRNYGYMIIENKSLFFLEKLKIIQNPNFLIFKIALILLFFSFVLRLVLRRSDPCPARRSLAGQGSKETSLGDPTAQGLIINFSLAAVFTVLALSAIRNFTFFGFFSLPILASNFRNSLFQKIKLELQTQNLLFGFFTFLIFALILSYYYPSLERRQDFGIGLLPGINKSAEFFQKENIQGPIFNNYDIGGYLIYHLFPKERVFVDNRPEAYPVSFFKNVYIPLQQEPSLWQKEDELYNFNVIFFSHRDATPWGQKFLIERIEDPFWAPVFADQYAIIFLKRNNQNQAIIEKYEIPKNYFRVTKGQ